MVAIEGRDAGIAIGEDAMSEVPSGFVKTSVPARIAQLGFSYMRPSDFQPVEMEVDEPRFEEPDFLLPLHACMASYAAVVFTVTARPAYEAGSVEEWARHHAQRQSGTVQEICEDRIGDLRVIRVEALQPSDAGEMHVRACFAEDGKRLLIIGGMAPEALWGTLERTLQTMIDSFRLETPRGQTTPLRREQVEADAGEVELNTLTKAADVALAGDAGSLDEEHPMNARLRDNGVGLVPRVLEVNVGERYARLGAGAIQSIINVPLGWHVIDDGKRTLVFDAGGKVQVNLNLRRADGDRAGFLGEILQQHLSEQPEIEHIMLDLMGMPCLAMRNYRVDGELLEQAFLLKDVHSAELVLVARVTASPEDMERAMNVAEVVLRDLQAGI